MGQSKTDDVTYDLFKEQPDSCRQPLKYKELDKAVPEYIKRVLLVNPFEIYERLRYKIQPYKRYNFIHFGEMFPDREDNKCSCGCGQEIPKNKKKWFSADCQRFSMAVFNIISCRQPDIVTFYLSKYYGNANCVKCGSPMKDLDHIVPIAEGAGGCWLSNYQFLCEGCHAQKTAEQNDWENSKHLKQK